MIHWFKKNNYPIFWKEYLKLFKDKQSNKIENTRFVVLDTETTGLEIKTDKILSIGAIGVLDNCLVVSDSFECYLDQTYFNPETVEIHGILKNGEHQIKEEIALENFIKYIGNAVIIAHHAAFDIAILNQALKNNHLPKLKNKVLDTGIFYKKLKDSKDKHYSLDQLSKEFNITMHDRHTASGDAYITAILFLKILSKLKKERTVHFSDLFTKDNNGLL